MRLRIAFSCVAAVFLASNAVAAGVTLTDRISKEIPLYIAGSFWIDNPVGSIEIYGSDLPGAVVTKPAIAMPGATMTCDVNIRIPCAMAFESTPARAPA